MEFCTQLQQRVLDLENTKTTQALEIKSLKRRVKKLEKKQGSRTHKLKRLYKVGLSAKVIYFDDEGLGDQEDASKQGRKIADINADAEVTLIDETHGRNDDNLMFDTCVLDEQEVEVEKVVSTAEVTTNSATTTIVDELTLAQTLIKIKASKPKDKGKAKMIKLEKPLKKKDQIMYDQEDNTQAMMDADYQLAQQLQAEEQEELSIEEKSKLFVQLLEARKKHFAEMRAREKRNKSPTQAQQRKLYSFKRVNTFVDYKTELMEESSKRAEAEKESSSKRAGEGLESNNSKKQKLDEKVEAELEDDKEKEELKQCFEIVPEEEIAIDAIPLATKPAPIVNFQIHRKGRNRYYEIMRADGTKHGYTMPEEAYESVLWGDLKIEDAVWRNLQGHNALELYDSCGVHFVRFDNMHVYMLVEKKYYLTPPTITDMLNKKLHADQWNEMCYQLLKLITKQLKNPRSV
ncbi:hypothetical protein Tco_0096933 [Tanacetum coccineum]